MAWKPRMNAEFAFVSAALLIALMGWIADFVPAAANLSDEYGHGSGDLFFRVNITFFALGLAAIGVGYEQHERFFREPTWGMRYVAGYLLVTDGILHGFAFNDHLAEPPHAAFFAVIAPTQIAVGLALPYLRRSWDAAWLGFAAFLVALYTGTRFAIVWPLGEIEEVEALGIFSKVIEGLAVVLLIQLLRTERRSRSTRTAPAWQPADAR